jgi:NTE family protein
MNDSKIIGLALSGGGARGIAHLGVIKALEELNIKINLISGTSAGAIIASLYAYGHTTDDILSILLDIKAFRFLQPAMSTKGLLKMDVMYKLLQKHLPEGTFDSLKIPTYIAATNLRLGETKYFNEGDLISAICASSCIPVLFKPIEIEGELYIDGGILNNLPIEPIREKSDILIASHSNPIDNNCEPKNFRFVMERALMLAITRNVYERKPQCNFFIEPKGLEPFKVLDISKAKEIYKIGYHEALRQIEEQKLLEQL